MAAVVRTLLFTDVVDSTALVERLGDEQAGALWARHDRLARDLLARNRGHEIDRTDGFFALFDDAGDAVRFARAYHAGLVTLGLQARVAVHTAAVTLRRTPDVDVARGAKAVEVEGLAKPLASRLLALAGGGRTLLSRGAHDALRSRGDPPLRRHGHYRLKGVAEPVEVYELEGGPTCSDAGPPPDTEKAYRVTRSPGSAEAPWQPARAVPNNLPAERDAFVGRVSDLRQLADLYDGGARLVTLLGPGGIGKTRLARRYARTWLGDWPGGAYFCDLGDARDATDLARAVAQALEVPLAGGDPATQLGHALAARGRCLLILDNTEQLLEHAAAAATRWLDRAGSAALLITSRERLRLPGESVLDLAPLELSDESVQLFTLRATALRSDLVIDHTPGAAVHDLVRLLEGMPLAIELAAARVRLLTPQQIVERLRDRLSLLGSMRPTTASRQATLRATIDWSWQLLQPWEQAAFAQCSVCEAGFTLATAEALLDLSAWPDAPAAIDVVQALVDKSLLRVTVDRDAASGQRLGCFASLQEYASERLAEGGPDAVDAVRSRHARVHAGFGAPEAIDALALGDGVRLTRMLAAELGNLVAACRHAIAHEDALVAVPCVNAIWAVVRLHGPRGLVVDLGDAVLALPHLQASARAELAPALGMALHMTGRPARGESVLAQGLRDAETAGKLRLQGRLHASLGDLKLDQARMGEAAVHYRAAEALARQTNDPFIEFISLVRQVRLADDRGQESDTDALCEQAAACVQRLGHPGSEAMLLHVLAARHQARHRWDDAEQCYRRAAALSAQAGHRGNEIFSVGNLGVVLLERGCPADALQPLQDARAGYRHIGGRYVEGFPLARLGLAYELLGDADRALEIYEEAIALARDVGNVGLEVQARAWAAALRLAHGRRDQALALLEPGLRLEPSAVRPLDAAPLRLVLSRLHLADGHVDDAQGSLEQAAEAYAGLEREPIGLLCARGHLALARGLDLDARGHLAEAEAAVREFGLGPASAAARDVRELRQSIAAANGAAADQASST